MDIPAYVLSHRHTLPYVLATCQAAAPATLSMYRYAYCNSDLRSSLVTFVTVGRPCWWEPPVARVFNVPFRLALRRSGRHMQHAQIHILFGQSVQYVCPGLTKTDVAQHCMGFLTLNIIWKILQQRDTLSSRQCLEDGLLGFEAFKLVLT
jgi:hypothetical protein